MKKCTISKKLKIVCMMLAAVALLTVSPTLAWLSATTEPVVNYFAGGTIAITLDEAPVDADGKEIEGARVQENHYKYMAGAVLDKDPTVTVLAGSEECYVYVCIENNLPSELFSLDINEAVWELVSTSGTKTIYRYAQVVSSKSEDQALTPVFTKVTVSENLTSDNITELGTKTLTVTAFAIQTAGPLIEANADKLAEAYFFDDENITSLEANETEAKEETVVTATETENAEVTASETEEADEADVTAEVNATGEAALDVETGEESGSDDNSGTNSETGEAADADDSSEEETETARESISNDTSEEDTTGDTESTSSDAEAESETENESE